MHIISVQGQNSAPLKPLHYIYFEKEKKDYYYLWSTISHINASTMLYVVVQAFSITPDTLEKQMWWGCLCIILDTHQAGPNFLVALSKI